MAKSLPEYAEWLDGRKLMWPAAPKRVPVTAKPAASPLAAIKGVVFNVYGTLLRIADGELLLQHPQNVRMEIALEKTIKEFNMWNSMTRKSGAPSDAMGIRYQRVLEEQRLAPTETIGDVPEIDSAVVWLKLIRQLQQKDYSYEARTYGEVQEFAEKVAYFFHSSLQGIEAETDALATLEDLKRSGKKLGLLADAQRFTHLQMLRAFRSQGTLRTLDELFDPALETLSFREGIRKPSKSLYRRCLERFRHAGIGASQILYVGTRLRDDLAIAKAAGMRTALLAADQISLAATRDELLDPELRPDRLLTSLAQVRQLVGLAEDESL
jgi:FMN phosphatase YigB (HAD superfamily)